MPWQTQMMSEQDPRLALLEARLPRYTSFPPANRFVAEVGVEHRRRWLAEIPEDEPISLYVHIPYCRRLCWFCACRTQGTKNESVLETYLDDLEIELDLTRQAIGRRQRVSNLHLGGGTPTFLPPDSVRRLKKMLDQNFNFDVAEEISVEIDPCEFDSGKCDALAEIGLTRASIGVQDFDPVVQAAIGREQGLEVTTTAVQLIRDKGVQSLNVDLLYGLPYQDQTRLLNTLDAVLSFSPDRIALYGYAHVPWVAKRQKLIPEEALPSSEERLELAALARRHLLEAGYQAVGIDHFAKPGDSMALAAQTGGLRRNFQGYTTDGSQTLVGLGASAISRFPQGYSHNTPVIRDWKSALGKGELASVRGYEMHAEDDVTSEIIERLMCDGRADINEISAKHDVKPDRWIALAKATLERFSGAGTLNDGVLGVAEMTFARLVASGFDDPEQLSGMRYSKAS